MSNTTTQKYSREDYMAKRCTHREYYGQFVTPAIKQMVISRFGIPTLLRSTDKHLNDIPLHQWDALAGCRMRGSELIGTPTPRIEDGSLSSTVCTFKEAAKQIIEEEKELNR